MGGDPSAIFGGAYTQWGALGLFIGLLLYFLLWWFPKLLEKRDEKIAALEAELREGARNREALIAAAAAAYNAAVAALNDKLLTAYQTTTEKLAAAATSQNATAAQAQQLATTLQSALDRLLKAGP